MHRDTKLRFLIIYSFGAKANSKIFKDNDFMQFGQNVINIGIELIAGICLIDNDSSLP